MQEYRAAATVFRSFKYHRNDADGYNVGYDPRRVRIISHREREVLIWLCSGNQVDRVAHNMGISTATVQYHLRSSKRKLGAKTREQEPAEAVRQAAGTPDQGTVKVTVSIPIAEPHQVLT